MLPQNKGVMVLPLTFPQKKILSQNLTLACSEQGDMSPPQPQNSRPLPLLLFFGDGVGEGLSVQALQRQCNDDPEQGSDSPSSDFPSKKISSQNPTIACSQLGDMSSPQSMNSGPLPRLSFLRDQGGEGLSVQALQGWCNAAPE